MLFNFFRVKNIQDAAYRKQILAISYAILGWNSFMLCFYIIMKDRLPNDVAERKAVLIEKLGTGNTVRSIRIDGLTVVQNEIIQK